jgi:Glycosyl transferase family 2
MRRWPAHHNNCRPDLIAEPWQAILQIGPLAGGWTCGDRPSNVSAESSPVVSPTDRRPGGAFKDAGGYVRPKQSAEGVRQGRAPIAVVVPCLNAARCIGSVLDAIAQQTIAHDAEVIVVDNGSTDRSTEIAQLMGARVLVCLTRGSAAARNYGIYHCSATTVLSLDADCTPAEDSWMEMHVEALMSSGPDVLGTGGPTIAAPGSDRWSQRLDVTPQPRWSEDGTPLYAVAGNACYRRDVLLDLGGFPPVGADDAALGMVARRAGLRFGWAPEAGVFHRNPVGWRGYFRQMRKIGRYTAELAEAPPRGSYYHSQCRRLASTVRPLARGEFDETKATLLKTIGQAVGSREAWRDARKLGTPGARWSATFRREVVDGSRPSVL